VYHSREEFVRGMSHINGIESFWSFVKRKMRKQNKFGYEEEAYKPYCSIRSKLLLRQQEALMRHKNI